MKTDRNVLAYLTTDEHKALALVRQAFGGTKPHPVYGKIPTNAGMAFYLIQNKGPHLSNENLKAVAEMFGYRYNILRRNYHEMVKVNKIFEDLND